VPGRRGIVSRLALAVLAGVLHGASFPPLGAWPFAFVALAPLVVSLRGASPGTAALLGWVTGTVGASIAGTPALTAGAHAYFAVGAGAAVAVASLLGQVFHALPTALFAVVASRLLGLPAAPARIVTVGAAWAGIEWLRAYAFGGGGSPWDLLAHPLYARPLWIQLADLGGTSLVSFVLAASATAVAELRVDARGAAATAAVVLGVTAGYGAWRLDQDLDGGPRLRVGLVQGDVPNAWRGDPARADEALRAFAGATREILPERPALVIWPENAISVLLAPNARVRAAIADALGADGPALLLGGPRAAQTAPGRAEFHNSAYLLGATGDVAGVYDKRRLVPFGEYVPMAALSLPGWRLAAPGDYSPGGPPTVFATPVPFGVLICFEGLYPDLAADLVRGGARLLVNVSNDAWFGAAGEEQTFAMTVFRSVEQRRPLVRVTNAGVSGVVGPSGRILARLPAGGPAARVVAVPLGEATSPYARVGDAFAWLALLLTGAGLWRVRS
jgi:apolipoprotein N-acyltransferase